MQPASNDLPPGATAIDTDQLLAAIGELYVQVRVLRGILARQQQAAAPESNHAVPEQP